MHKMILSLLLASTFLIADTPKTRVIPFPFGEKPRTIIDSTPVLSHTANAMLVDHFYIGPDSIDPNNIKDGDILCVPLRMIESFAATLFPKINAKIIIRSNVRYAFPPATMKKILKIYKQLLDHENVGAWFGTNMPIELGSHPKALLIPHGHHWLKPKNFKFIESFLKKLTVDKYFKKKKIFCYVNFGTTSRRRKRFLGTKHQNPFCKHVTFGKYCPFPSFMKKLENSQFVISPPGLNPDCYRHWETLYAGSIPIVEKTGIESVFKDLPVLIIDNYDNLTPEFLHKKLKAMEKKTYNLDKLTAGYWVERIKERQRAIRSECSKTTN